MVMYHLARVMGMGSMFRLLTGIHAVISSDHPGYMASWDDGNPCLLPSFTVEDPLRRLLALLLPKNAV